MEVDEFTYQNDDYLVVFAAGNSGPYLRTVGSPATSKNSLSVGSSSNTRDSYIEHGYGLCYNLSMRVRVSDDMRGNNTQGHEKLVDILPAGFGSTLCAHDDALPSYSDSVAVLDVYRMSRAEERYFCTDPIHSSAGCPSFADDTSTPTWAVVNSTGTLGNSNGTLTDLNSWHTIYGGDCNDCFELLPDFGFDLCIFGQNVRDQSFVGSNSYITFGQGSRAFSSYAIDQISTPSLRLGAGDRSYQRVYGKYVNESGDLGYMVRFEGTASVRGVPGRPNIVWEVIFWSNQSIIMSVPTFPDSDRYCQWSRCDFGLYDEYAMPAATFGYPDASVIITNFSKPVTQTVPFTSSDSAVLLVLYFNRLEYRRKCDHGVFALNAGRANFSAVVFASTSQASSAKKISSQAQTALNVSIPVMSISGMDARFFIMEYRGQYHQYGRGSSSIVKLVNMHSAFPVVSSVRSDRTFTHMDLSSFSSRGPTYPDARYKPDIVAPGQDIFSAKSDGRNNTYQCGATTGKADSSILSMSGTSMAAPGVAAAAALVRQYYMEGFHVAGNRQAAAGFHPSSALVKATILQSGHQIRQQTMIYGSYSSLRWSKPSHSPSYEQGYGLMDLSSALSFTHSPFTSYPIDRQVVDDGDHLDFCFTTESNIATDAHFRATLVWTDPPGYPYAAKALVNNLDLSIITTDGKYFYGNVPNSSDGHLDTVNNVEQITLKDLGVVAPPTAELVVRVSGTDVPEGPQVFALLVSGPVLRSNCSISSASCENQCSGNGNCKGGICICEDHFGGVDCSIPECGNGRISSNEECDDGNALSGDGCSSECRIETGFRCQNVGFFPDQISSCSKCECGCVRLTNTSGVIRSNGSHSPYSYYPCEYEIDPPSNGEIQITVETMPPGSWMYISVPCSTRYMYDSYSQCRQTVASFRPEFGMQSWTSSLSTYNGMRGIRLPMAMSKIFLRVHAREQHVISYGPAAYDVCGDGIVEGSETCEDSNTVNGDGCSSRCWLECDWDHCCTVDLSDLDNHGTFRPESWLEASLQHLIPGHEFSPNSSCMKLLVSNDREDATPTSLDLKVHGNVYSDTCPFWANQVPLSMIGPAAGSVSFSQAIPSNAISWTSCNSQYRPFSCDMELMAPGGAEQVRVIVQVELVDYDSPSEVITAVVVNGHGINSSEISQPQQADRCNQWHTLLSRAVSPSQPLQVSLSASSSVDCFCPDCFRARMILVPSNESETNVTVSWSTLPRTNYHQYAVPDLGFDFCVLGENVRESIDIYSQSFVTFGSNRSEYFAHGFREWSASNPPLPTLFVGTQIDPNSGYNYVRGVFGAPIMDQGRRGYVVRFEAYQSHYGVSGYEMKEILWEITFFEDNSIHVANARGLHDTTSIFMLTDGLGRTISRFGRQTQISSILPPTPGCGVSHASQPCSMLRVESQNFSGAVSSGKKFRSSQDLVLVHASHGTLDPWRMPIEVAFWQGVSPARCGNGLLDSDVATVFTANCRVTNSSHGVCRQNVTVPDIPSDSPLTALIDIRVKPDLFARYRDSYITDVYIDGIRVGGNYLSGYVSMSGSSQCKFMRILEYPLPSNVPGPRDVSVEILFQHDYWLRWYSDRGYPLPCYCSPCQRTVLDSTISVKLKQPTEECDDANSVNGDGCSAHCMVEHGATCTGATRYSGPSVCSGGSGVGNPGTCLVDVPYQKRNWGQDQRYLSCSFPLTWTQILKARFEDCTSSFKTGGLGSLMVEDAFESWICVPDHPCASNYPHDQYFCFVYDEQRKLFVPWGENAELGLVRP